VRCPGTVWGSVAKGPQFHAAILADNAAVAERVLARIGAEGVLSAADFELEHGAAKDWFGMPENVVRAVLEGSPFAATSVWPGVRATAGTTTCWNGCSRPSCSGTKVPEREQRRHKMLSRYRAHGLLGTGGAAGTFDRIAPPKSTDRTGWGATRCAAELLELGAWWPVEIEDLRGKRLVLAEELTLLQAPPEPVPSVAFIARSTPCCGTQRSSRSSSTSNSCGRASSPPGETPLGLVRASRSSSAPLRRPDRTTDRPGPGLRRGPRRLVGRRLPAGPGDGFVEAMRDALGAYLRFAGADHLEWAAHLGAEEQLFLAQP